MLSSLDWGNDVCHVYGHKTPDSADKTIPTGTYMLYCGEGAREAMEEAYGPSLRNGVCYSETRLARKVDVVPTLTAIFGR